MGNLTAQQTCPPRSLHEMPSAATLPCAQAPSANPRCRRGDRSTSRTLSETTCPSTTPRASPCLQDCRLHDHWLQPALRCRKVADLQGFWLSSEAEPSGSGTRGRPSALQTLICRDRSGGQATV